MSERTSISVVMASRNDDYEPNTNFRLELALNFELHELEIIGRASSVEYVIVDFMGRTPLSETLVVPRKFQDQIRVLRVPPDPNKNPNLDFLTSTSVNLGISQSRGCFVSVRGSDTFMTRYGWLGLFNLLEESESQHYLDRRVLLSPRKIIPDSVVGRNPSNDDLFLWIHSSPNTQSKENQYSHTFQGGSYGAIIASNSFFKDLGGFDSRYNKWGFNDNDIVIRANWVSNLFDLDSIGVRHYKLAHQRGGRRLQKIKSNDFSNPTWVNPAFSTRDNNTWEASIEMVEERVLRTSESYDVSRRYPDPFIELYSKEITVGASEWASRLGDKYIRDVTAQLVSYFGVGSATLCDLCLAWYCENLSPKQILILGNPAQNPQARIIGYFSKGTNLLLIEHHACFKSNVEPNFLKPFGTGLAGTDFSGGFRPVIGDAVEALTIISSGHSTSFNPELVIVNLDCLPETSVPLLFSELFSKLKQSEILITSNSERLLHAALSVGQKGIRKIMKLQDGNNVLVSFRSDEQH